MDLTEIFEEHKKFIAGVAAALIVFFIGTRIVNSMYVAPSDRLDKSADRMARKLRNGTAPSKTDLRDVRRAGETADERLEAIESRVRFEPDSRFVLAPGSDFDLVYNDRYREVSDEILERASIEDVEVDPSLGMPETTPVDREEVQAYLKALDQVRRVVTLAMDSGVLAVPAIRVLPEARKGFLASQTYLNRIRVEYELTGSADAIALVVQDLQTGESYFAIADAKIELDPKNPDLVRAELEVAALEPDPQATALVERGSRRGRR